MRLLRRHALARCKKRATSVWTLLASVRLGRAASIVARENDIAGEGPKNQQHPDRHSLVRTYKDKARNIVTSPLSTFKRPDEVFSRTVRNGHVSGYLTLWPQTLLASGQDCLGWGAGVRCTASERFLADQRTHNLALPRSEETRWRGNGSGLRSRGPKPRSPRCTEVPS
jgi:hypothetical protein